MDCASRARLHRLGGPSRLHRQYAGPGTPSSDCSASCFCFFSVISLVADFLVIESIPLLCLRAYLRAITRSFWFMRDVKNFEYLRDLEKNLRRSNTHNEDERGVVAIVTAPDRLESWALPIDGGIAPEAVQRIADDMVKSGKLSKPIAAKDILRDDAVKQAYREVSDRADLKAPFGIALAAQEKYGF